nr:putative ribonuclease H-like domain-containing protein [Tanacetum cinerariifolium]
KLELCIIKKEKEYVVLWNNWYTKCEECKYDKISYDKAYNDMQQKVKRLQAQLRDLKGTSVTPQADKPKLIAVSPYSKKLHASILSHSVPQPREFNVMNHRNVIAPGMFKIDSSQTSRVDMENVSSDTVNASSTGLVHTARTRRPPPKGNSKNVRVPSASKSSEVKKMYKNIKLLINFVWKFLGTVRFGNDHIASILGYGDLKWGNITITRVYLVEGGNTCFIRDLDGIDLLKDDYSPYTWVYFLRTKDETPELIKNFLKKIYVRLQAPVIIVRIDNETEFKNHVLKEYFDSVGITHETFAAKTPQQNGVIERKNYTLVDAARTMLIFSHAPLSLWAEAIATACYTQNRSIIYRRFNKTPYELIQGRKPDISYLYVFGALFYPKNDRKDISKLGAKGDIGFFIGFC